MLIAIHNKKNEDHKIKRLNGLIETIPANSYKIIVVNLAHEINYWCNVKDTVIEKEGISVIRDARMIRAIQKMLDSKNVSHETMSNNETVNVSHETIKTENTDVSHETIMSIVDNGESPIAKEIADSVNASVMAAIDNIEKEDSANFVETNEVVEFVSTDETSEITDTNEIEVAYTEDILKTKTNKELQAICDSMGKHYKKNNSKATLIKLILE